MSGTFDIGSQSRREFFKKVGGSAAAEEAVVLGGGGQTPTAQAQARRHATDPV